MLNYIMTNLEFDELNTFGVLTYGLRGLALLEHINHPDYATMQLEYDSLDLSDPAGIARFLYLTHGSAPVPAEMR